MASIRGKPKHFRRGGRVIADDAGTLVMVPPEDAGDHRQDPQAVDAAKLSAQTDSFPPEPPPENSSQQREELPEPSPFVAILAAQARAEELQRQRAEQYQQSGSFAAKEQPSFRDQIAALAATDPFKHKAALFHHQAALAEGIEDNSAAMRDRILAGIAAEVQEQHRLAVENLQTRAPALMPREQGSKSQPATPIITDNVSNDPPPAPRKSSIPFTAPPSRDVAPMGGGKRQRDTSMHLTAEERLIARNSIIDRPDMPAMSNAEKELLYARNKKRLLEMRASGEYRQTTEQSG